MTEGDSVTLSCEITDSSTDWKFRWYTAVPYRHNDGRIRYRLELLSDSSGGSGGSYTLSPAALNHTGVYVCRAAREERPFYTNYSHPQPLWITGESPPVSLIINPSRTQHFTVDSLSLNCEDQSDSTGWRVIRYTLRAIVSDCSQWGSVTGSTCEISFLSTSYTGVYWCESESGENSNPVNITVHDGDVILESPVHPVTEGHPLTLRCLHRNTKSSNLRADFYKDGSVLQTQTTGEMIIRTVSKSDEGFYHCKHPERGESLKSWVSLVEPGAVLSVSPQSWMTEGDSVTLSCEITDSSTDWTFSWYTEILYRDNDGRIVYRLELLSDSSRGSGGSYTLSPAALNHTGVYICTAAREEQPFYTNYSHPQPLWITGESPPVSLIINPSRTQHFTRDSLSLSCEDQSNSTGWRVIRYTHREIVSDCSLWGSVTGSTCEISSLYTFYTGVYWCESESGENSNPVNITVHDGDVILESPVHPVTEGHPLTLRCLHRNTKSSNLRADFYKDGSVLQTQTTGEMIIRTVSKSDEGFYHCKHPERGESLKSWVSVRGSGSRSSAGTVGVAVGLSLAALFIILLILMILLWFCKIKKGNQTSEQNQSRSGAEDSQSGHTPLQAEGNAKIYTTVDQADTSGTGEAAAESREDTYAEVTEKNKAKGNNDVDAEPSGSDVTYSELVIKPQKKSMRIKEKASVGADTVYSELKLNTKTSLD
ncbi:Fc receptor-like protein 5 [Ictalurus punctatus]|uniref:Fc receptor-like protein 5 n=1 Tax=Ictalurus punctatus TaxID=7998 RepID=A0A9F7THW6_ICTPU|nr:Fc receptor-like protein 5 [Ictalurus punctatus]